MEMRKFVLFFFFFIMGLNSLFAQARTNAELAKFFGDVKIFTNISGWSQDRAGQWKSSKYEAPGWSTYFTQFALWNVSYQNKDYVLLGLYERDIGYKYPTSKVGPYYYTSLNYCLFNPKEFVIILKRNQKYDNTLNCVLNSYIEDRNIQFTDDNILKSVTSGLLNKTSEYSYYKLKLFTYYYTDDNVVRFWLASGYFGGVTETMPEDHYFECSFKEFSEFFNIIID
jgi:hypothetical protein